MNCSKVLWPEALHVSLTSRNHTLHLVICSSADWLQKWWRLLPLCSLSECTRCSFYIRISTKKSKKCVSFTGRFHQWRTWQRCVPCGRPAVDMQHQHDTVGVDSEFPSRPTFAPSCVDCVGNNPAETYAQLTTTNLHIQWAVNVALRTLCCMNC